MLARTYTAALFGLEGILVEVQVNIIKKGFPCFRIGGLVDRAIEEAKDRVYSSLIQAGFKFPSAKLIINLAPANVKKEGPHFDLPIALSILTATGEMQLENGLKSALFFGELSLDGALRAVQGILPLCLVAHQLGIREVFLPLENAQEASIVQNITVYPVRSLSELINHSRGKTHLTPFKQPSKKPEEQPYEIDFSMIRGQEQAKRALEIAAAGFHHLAMRGPPGAGKTLLARSLPSILPALDFSEAVDTTRIYSVVGKLDTREPLVQQRPFRAPHHTISRAGLIGGGTYLRPGEISLAHHGALFLDEFNEFPRGVIESLRQPLEDRYIRLARAHGSATFPCSFMLITAANPCPCGYLGSAQKECTCNFRQILTYQKRISGSVYDRIDLQLNLQPVETDKLISGDLSLRSETSSQVKKRVEAAINKQKRRYQQENFKYNGLLTPGKINQYCLLGSQEVEFIKQVMNKYQLSARSCHKLIKLSRTIADLAAEERIRVEHLAEATQYRLLDPQRYSP